MFVIFETRRNARKASYASALTSTCMQGYNTQGILRLQDADIILKEYQEDKILMIYAYHAVAKPYIYVWT